MLQRIWLAAVLIIAGTQWIRAEDGIAWQIQGGWRANQTQDLIRRGDAVTPGTLLTADDSTNASILVLLPDGQRLLFDCHDAHTCKQGFRVPALIAKPDDDAIELFDAVRTTMQQQPAANTANRSHATTTETEAIVPMHADGTIALKQALAGLPPGQYRMTVQGESDPQISERSLTWSGPHDEAQWPLSHPGIYRLRLFGSLGGERMRVMLLAESPKLFPSVQKAFAEAKNDLEEWNETFPGWPTHEWLQLFLRSLAQPQGAKP